MSNLKVLIADDELPIRRWFSKTIRTLPDIKVDLVGAAANGEEALALFREHKPDVIFADIKMPLMNGLDLLRAVKAERPATEVVMVTSYDEFSYAKEAISQDAFDYLLKTEATAKRLSELLWRIQRAREAATQNSDEVSRRFTKEIFLNRLLSGELGSEDCTEETLNRHGIFLQEKGMFAVAFQTNNFAPDRLAEAFLNVGVAHVIYYSYQKNTMVALANTDCIDQLAYQNQVVFQFADKLGRCFDSPVGISRIYYKYDQLPTMITTAVTALSQSFYDQRPRSVYYAQDCADRWDPTDFFQQWEREIALKLRGKELQDISGQIERLLNEVAEKRPGDISAVKQFLFHLMTCLYMTAYQERLELADQLSTLHRQIEDCPSFALLRSFIVQTVGTLVEEREDSAPQYTPSTAKAVAYIKKNYATIQSVSQVADHVGLNPDYFCHLFKRDTGVTFSQFLKTTRMNMAIWLLNNTNLKFYEISERIGYTNQSYFSKLFKQQFNMTPYEFRALNGAPQDAPPSP